MDAAQRELNDQIDQATQRLLDDARTLPEAALRAPSLLPRWTRAHVLAHVARNADAMRNLLIGARSGQDRAAYASAQAREADIERGAATRAEDLIADLADSSMALRTMVRQLPDHAWQVPVRVLDSAPFPAAGLLTRRLVEVELHHCDLAVGYSPADWPAAFATMELTEPMRSQRQDRLRYPPPSPDAKPALPGRPLAPFKPGQRLPGSWLGTGDQSRPLPTSPARGPIPVRDGYIHIELRARRSRIFNVPASISIRCEMGPPVISVVRQGRTAIARSPDLDPRANAAGPRQPG
jgi:maleylpyruvate isomerase